MSAQSTKTITVNGRDYAWPSRPLVVVCVDGSQPEYIEDAIKAGFCDLEWKHMLQCQSKHAHF